MAKAAKHEDSELLAWLCPGENKSTYQLTICAFMCWTISWLFSDFEESWPHLDVARQPAKIAGSDCAKK